MTTYIDVHIIQTVPPSNINRDDTGSPKSAVYGGVRRSRVSSQAWKRATRAEFSSHLDTAELGVRTKRVVEQMIGEIVARRPDQNPRRIEQRRRRRRIRLHAVPLTDTLREEVRR